MTGEDELIRRAQAGDLEAFCRLAREYERRVYTLALHYCRDPADAEDLSQEVWLKVFKSLGGFRSESSFHTWLRRITVNTFLNHRRAMQLTREDGRAAIRLESIEELADEPALAESLSHGEAENGFHQRILFGRVMRALGELSEQQRLIFLLKHREGMTCTEIAEVFGCSVGAVKKSLFRSIEKLRASFGVGEGVAQPAGGKS